MAQRKSLWTRIGLSSTPSEETARGYVKWGWAANTKDAHITLTEDQQSLREAAVEKHQTLTRHASRWAKHNK